MERRSLGGFYRQKQQPNLRKQQQENKIVSKKQCKLCQSPVNEREIEQHMIFCSKQQNFHHQEIQERSSKQNEEVKLELPEASHSQEEEQKLEIFDNKNQAKSFNQLKIQELNYESSEIITCDKCQQVLFLFEFDDHMMAHEMQEKTPTNKDKREFINALLEQLHNVAQIKEQCRHNRRGANPEELQEFSELLAPQRLSEAIQGGLRVILAPQPFQASAPEDEYELDKDQFDRGKGLSERQISKIKKQKIDKETAKKLGTCCICLSDFKGGDLCRNLECQHIFHIHCIDEWLSRKTSCPICKNRLYS